MEAVNVLNDAIVAIQNKAVDNSICLRLKGLFNSCTEEYINLQNTYSKLGEKIFEKFYTLKSIHIRLQKECDAMKFCDSTLIFVEAMVEKILIMLLLLEMEIMHKFNKMCEIQYKPLLKKKCNKNDSGRERKNFYCKNF